MTLAELQAKWELMVNAMDEKEKSKDRFWTGDQTQEKATAHRRAIMRAENYERSYMRAYEALYGHCPVTYAYPTRQV